MNLEYFDWCQACQDRHVRQAEAEVVREREAVELAEQEAVRKHAAATAAHRKASGWDPRRATELDQLIASSSRGHTEPAGMGLAPVVGVVALAGLALNVYSVLAAPPGSEKNLFTLVACSAVVLPMLAWAISRYVAGAAWQQRQSWISERDRLQQAQGCGTAGCPRCRF